MDLKNCIDTVDRYLKKDNTQPMLIDVQKRTTLDKLYTHYRVGNNRFISVSSYCKDDQLPLWDQLLADLQNAKQPIFFTDSAAFLKIHGTEYTKRKLYELLSLYVPNAFVIITYQCRKELVFKDKRAYDRILVLDEKEDPIPSIYFLNSSELIPSDYAPIHGINHIFEAILEPERNPVYIITDKRKDAFPNSLLRILEISSPYLGLCMVDPLTSFIDETFGTDSQWEYALQTIKGTNWQTYVDTHFGSSTILDASLPHFDNWSEDEQWLYLVTLKLFNMSENKYLRMVMASLSLPSQFRSSLYRKICECDISNSDYARLYRERKSLLSQININQSDCIDFCNFVKCKGKYALYYLTDLTQSEKETVFELLDLYGQTFTREELEQLFRLTYPDLSDYLSNFIFRDSLLTNYFDQYRYQKIINKILPEFYDLVKEQSFERRYNRILLPRWTEMNKIDRTGAQLYFIDAMGVEYIPYMEQKCGELGLSLNIHVCRCELPSLTKYNKEFESLVDSEHITSIKNLDNLKHDGINNLDYEHTKLPIHLIAELKLLSDVANKIKEHLTCGDFKKAIIISDHGASRLAVINESESLVQMDMDGSHSGRCCLKSEVDVQPDFATDAGDYWALANYDRFKGSRRASVEVHGGATLEEVAVPIIEVSLKNHSIEIVLLPVEESISSSQDVPTIAVSYKKKAQLKLYSTSKLDNPYAVVNNQEYPVTPMGDGFYHIDLSNITQKNSYLLDVYSSGSIVAKNLPFKVVKESGGERDIL